MGCTRFGGHFIMVFIFKPELGMTARQRFSREYELEAVRMVTERWVSMAQGAHALRLCNGTRFPLWASEIYRLPRK